MAKQLAKIDINVLDWEIINQETYKPGRMSYRLIVYFFGVTCLDGQKNIDWKKIELICRNPKLKRLLSRITKPFLFWNFLYKVYSIFIDNKDKLACLDINQLLNGNFFKWFVYPICVVYISDNKEWEKRLVDSSIFKKEDAKKYVEEEEEKIIRKKGFNLKIDNSGPIDILYTKFLVEYTRPGSF